MAAALLKYETIDIEQIKRIFAGQDPGEPESWNNDGPSSNGGGGGPAATPAVGGLTPTPTNPTPPKPASTQTCSTQQAQCRPGHWYRLRVLLCFPNATETAAATPVASNTSRAVNNTTHARQNLTPLLTLLHH